MEKERYVKQCPTCENYVEGREMRGIVRQMVHDGPEAIVEWVPVGGKLVLRGTKEVAKLLLKTNMEQERNDQHLCLASNLPFLGSIALHNIAVCGIRNGW